ncbi:ComF family protein [Kutzneria buriramensis]|uniref:Putative amidophosphoribosyltransferase n=1 Tax=Kutzneria buriramensis TaxID=1045776 RepID=A0A3E0IB97_9PSEU|nr:ComF family protein [Kutzneria buriramensis]REH55826.1 putative amidophosphoribosyltransferase [Kutzneria buriramensis]
MTTKLLDLVLPVRCVGCRTGGRLWCESCAAEFGGPLPVHRAPITDGPPAYALAPYRGAPRDAVLAYKERGRRELAEPLGAAVARALPWIPEARPGPDGVWWLVPAPSRRRTSRQRGGEHMTKLARWCAAELARAGHGVAVAPMLELARSAADSVGLDPTARAANLAGRVRLRPRASPPRGAPVVLLDDVITTGATAAACHQVLTAAGLEVTAIVALTSTD